MAAEAKVCPPQVLALVDHLRSTGTGQSKLDKITELGKVTCDLNEFLAMLPNNVPPQTMQKVDEYLGKCVTEKETKETGKKPDEGWLNTEKGKALQKSHKEAARKAEGKGATRTETRDESQSSIPEHTVIQENKAPVLQKEGDSHSKQLGADVEVPAGDSPLDNKDAGKKASSEDSEEKSEVSDMNVEEAKDKISRMQSKPKLEAIIVADSRKSVQTAAQKRLDELEGKTGWE